MSLPYVTLSHNNIKLCSHPKVFNLAILECRIYYCCKPINKMSMSNVLMLKITTCFRVSMANHQGIRLNKDYHVQCEEPKLFFLYNPDDWSRRLEMCWRFFLGIKHYFCAFC